MHEVEYIAVALLPSHYTHIKESSYTTLNQDSLLHSTQ